ncbi:hypothetical protein A3SI_15683 [Nitritalea halalkaliphila LW7]|uniref:DUF4131 domain-containing protein n=1 Tax=Nitritalea halalkaliphila LW7 TaxID=1189621 RepID=I5BYB7_9BACT|nr:hypothetical protein A3SI_15683 [Nitritalea halalkaliphila LW7]
MGIGSALLASFQQFSSACLSTLAYAPAAGWDFCGFSSFRPYFLRQAQREPEEEPLEGLFIVEIRSSVLDRGYRKEYRARTLRVKPSEEAPWQKSVQELLFYEKDSLLQAGDRLLVRGVRRPFRAAENPYAFDYKRFQTYNGLEGALYPEAFWRLPGRGFFPLERLSAWLEAALQRYLAEDIFVQQVARASCWGRSGRWIASCRRPMQRLVPCMSWPSRACMWAWSTGFSSFCSRRSVSPSAGVSFMYSLWWG